MGNRFNFLNSPITHVAVIALISLLLNLWHVNYGLPTSFIADEAEISEKIIDLVRNYKQYITAGEFIELKPLSFIFGTVPTYYLTIVLILINKLFSLFSIGQLISNQYLVIRVVIAVTSALIPIFIYLTYRNLTTNRNWAFLAGLVAAFNWRIIAYSHFSNHDIFLTVFTAGLCLFVISYDLQQKHRSLFLLLIGTFLGLSVGTKITGIIAAIPIAIYFLTKRQYKRLFLILLTGLFVYFVTNPFSAIMYKNLISSLQGMLGKEAGVVLSSVDTSPFKYLWSIIHAVTWPVAFMGLWGFYFLIKQTVSKSKIYTANTTGWGFMAGLFLIYLAFFTLQLKRSDRYMLPIIPVVISFGIYGIQHIALLATKKSNYLVKTTICFLIISVLGIYGFFTFTLLKQLSVNRPSVSAFTWLRNNIKKDPTTGKNERILVYTEEGRSPLIGLRTANVLRVNTYASEGAFETYPVDPLEYKWVVISSTTASYYSKDFVRENYPEYFNAWNTFFNTVTSSQNFELVQSFDSGTGMNLFNVSDMYIYRRR